MLLVLPFLICAVTGGLQTYILSVVLKGALSGNMKSTLLALLGKFFCYGVALALLWFLFMDDIIYGAAGFVVGVVASVIGVAVKSRKTKTNNESSDKGDDS